MPSMPIYLWGDETGERYRDSYFAMFPGVWRHGDWIEITSRGSGIIYGRSDSTINRGGVRMGTSEIYRSVLSLEQVLEALVVDLPREGTDGWMSLFVVLREGVVLDDALIAEIRRRLRVDCSPRHVPDEVRQIAQVPRTLSGNHWPIRRRSIRSWRWRPRLPKGNRRIYCRSVEPPCCCAVSVVKYRYGHSTAIRVPVQISGLLLFTSA
jgi:acyl-coenzyme A synthetase/AMP-(fatty) acid ligase